LGERDEGGWRRREREEEKERRKVEVARKV